MTIPYKTIELTGSAVERGRTYGREAKAEILGSIRNYKELFDRRMHITWDKAKEVSRSFIPSIEAAYPEALEEIRGIAEGAGLEFEDILTLNCRSEIIFALPDACSAAGILPRDSADGHTYLGQTWDWIESSRDTIVILRIHQDPKPKLLILTEAGIIGGKGFNDRGIGVTLTATSAGYGRVGLPLHIMYRMILNAPSLCHAYEAVTAQKRAGSGCFNLGSADGLLGSLEFTPDDFDILMPVTGPLAHTNHYLSTELKPLSKKYVATHTNSIIRLNALQQALHEAGGAFDFKKLRRVFSDHRDFPNSVCKHCDPDTPASQRSVTVYAILMDLTTRTLLFFPGNTCEEEPVTLTFDTHFAA